MLSRQIPEFQKKILTWYQKNARDLPWRKTKNPYAIWVSEIMLQQTQVKTVIPYYEKWMKRFPTVEILAEAPLSEVLKYWAGLGYYRRARMLHSGAQILTNEAINLKQPEPAAFAAFRKLPGIGRYTAGAIASIAFEEKVPVLDGNVIRILSRITAFKEDVSKPAAIKKLWELAEKILPEKKIGDFNQSLMELGATVCFPRNPDCGACPVKSFCRASKKDPEAFPFNGRKEVLQDLKTAALILKQNGKVLLQQQPAKERWGGLWMFPHWQSEKEMLLETGLKKSDLKHRLTVNHGFTKYRITLKVYEQQAEGKEVRGKAILPKPSALSPLPKKWAPLCELSSLALPSPHQKIAKDLIRK